MIEPTNDDERTNSLGLFNTAQADPEQTVHQALADVARSGDERSPLPAALVSRPHQRHHGTSLGSR